MGVGVDADGTVRRRERSGDTDEESHVLLEWPVWDREDERSARRVRVGRYDGFEGEWRIVLEVRVRDHWEERTTLGYADDVDGIEIGGP